MKRCIVDAPYSPRANRSLRHLNRNASPPGFPCLDWPVLGFGVVTTGMDDLEFQAPHHPSRLFMAAGVALAGVLACVMADLASTGLNDGVKLKGLQLSAFWAKAVAWWTAFWLAATSIACATVVIQILRRRPQVVLTNDSLTIQTALWKERVIHLRDISEVELIALRTGLCLVFRHGSKQTGLHHAHFPKRHSFGALTAELKKRFTIKGLDYFRRY